MSLLSAIQVLFQNDVKPKVDNLLDHGSVNDSRVVVGAVLLVGLLWLTHGMLLPWINVIGSFVLYVLTLITVTKVAVFVMNGLIRITEIKAGIGQTSTSSTASVATSTTTLSK